PRPTRIRRRRSSAAGFFAHRHSGALAKASEPGISRHNLEILRCEKAHQSSPLRGPRNDGGGEPHIASSSLHDEWREPRACRSLCAQKSPLTAESPLTLGHF